MWIDDPQLNAARLVSGASLGKSEALAQAEREHRQRALEDQIEHDRLEKRRRDGIARGKDSKHCEARALRGYHKARKRKNKGRRK